MTAPSGLRAQDDPRRPRRVLASCGITHVLHDGFSDLIYLLLPLWQAELGLSLALLLRPALARADAA